MYITPNNNISLDTLNQIKSKTYPIFYERVSKDDKYFVDGNQERTKLSEL